MKFVPKELEDNVNISHQHPLKNFFLLLGALLGIILLIYIVLGIAVDLVVPKLSPEIEMRLGNMYSKFYEGRKNKVLSKQEEEIQKILNKLVEETTFQLPYKIHIISTPNVNAIALPGGNIVVTTALIQEMDSENELAFILAHELGHFNNRDHLRGLGRGIILLTVSTAMFGIDSSVSQILQNSLQNVEMKFSQRREIKADMFAIELLNKEYGYVSGAIDFFKKMAKKERKPRFLYFFSTHPYSQKRVNLLDQEIAIKKYSEGKPIPLSRILKWKSENL